MNDERAKRAAEKVWVAGDFGDSGGGFAYSQADVEETASIIASEYADVLAENERLKAALKSLVGEKMPSRDDFEDARALLAEAESR